MYGVSVFGVIVFHSDSIRACYRYLRRHFRRGRAAKVIRLGIFG